MGHRESVIDKKGAGGAYTVPQDPLGVGEGD